MSFTDALKAQSETTFTLNGAVAFNTTKNPLLDLFYLGGAARTMSDEDIARITGASYAVNAHLTIRCLFYLRDIRGGQGERRFFRVAMQYLFNIGGLNVDTIMAIPEYGRWDDLFDILAKNETLLFDLLFQQLREDCLIASKNKEGRVSLLAKWMPSINAGKKSKALAKKFIKHANLKEREYRGALKGLRGEIKIVEQKMCANAWGEINYPAVPSQAQRIYRRAFKKHDELRYDAYIENVAEGKEKINTKALFPYEILRSYGFENGRSCMPYDGTLEAMWANLPDYCEGSEDNSLVICDTSGSMSGLPMCISLSLAVYMAQRNKGVFKDYFMTFSSRPQMTKLQGNSLLEIVNNIELIVANTDICAAFSMLLQFALQHKATAEEMPKALYVISDMQFDENGKGNYESTFHMIKKLWEQAGYTLPKVVFWNVNNAGGEQMPVQKDEINTVLVSGCSPSVFKQVAAGKYETPMSYMMGVLESERYRNIPV